VASEKILDGLVVNFGRDGHLGVELGVAGSTADFSLDLADLLLHQHDSGIGLGGDRRRQHVLRVARVARRKAVLEHRHAAVQSAAAARVHGPFVLQRHFTLDVVRVAVRRFRRQSEVARVPNLQPHLRNRKYDVCIMTLRGKIRYLVMESQEKASRRAGIPRGTIDNSLKNNLLILSYLVFGFLRNIMEICP